MAGKWHQVGTIRLSKPKDDGTPGKLYIQFKGSTNKEGKVDTSGLNALAEALKNPGQYGVSLQIEKPQDKVRKLAKLGYIEEDQLENRLNSIPDYIKYEIQLPPQND